MALRAELDLVTARLAEAEALLRSARAAQTQAIAALESAVRAEIRKSESLNAA